MSLLASPHRAHKLDVEPESKCFQGERRREEPENGQELSQASVPSSEE